ncbi:MAG: hypothetical protein WBE68_12025 [Candidatus Nitrosopolaris sp.]|jgi:hypothetical protein
MSTMYGSSTTNDNAQYRTNSGNYDYTKHRDYLKFNVVNENQKLKFSYGVGTIIPQHRPVRASFDSLLDFFCKLEYLLGIGLIKCEELSYFKNYIDRAANNDSIVNYTLMYEFPLNSKLNRNTID